jgi:FkbM family methyltransferase
MTVVSIVVPAYNRMDWLPQTVDSILGQTFRDFELLVVDDGSTDGTAAWLATLDDPRLRAIWLQHTGNVARVRNAGAARATGRFLCFLDSDDLWLPRKLEVQVADAALSVGGWSYTRYEHIDELGFRIAARAGDWRALSGRIALSLISMEASVSIVTVLVPRDLFMELGGFDERPQIREDHEFLVRLATRADARALSECLVLVRDHPGRTTRMLRGAEPYLLTARTYETLLESVEGDEARSAARRRRAEHLVEAAAAHLRARSIADAAACIRQAMHAGASPGQCVAAVARGLGLERKLLRRVVRPFVGRESRIWRWLPRPELRRRFFGDPIDCVIHALLASKRRVFFIQIGANDGATNDPLWTFRRYDNWSGVLVEPLDRTFHRLSRNYAPWKDRFMLVHAAIAEERGPRLFYHFLESEDVRENTDQLASFDRDHLERHAHRFEPGQVTIVSSEVPCLAWGDLLDMPGVDTPDLLHIDAEGFDAAILDQVDLESDPPAVLLYEHINLADDVRAALRARLEDAGYETLETGADTLAVYGRALITLPVLNAAWRLVAAESPLVPHETSL